MNGFVSRGALRRAAAPLGVMVVAALLVSAPGMAAPTWVVPSVLLSPADGEASSHQVAMNAEGDVVVVWQSGYDAASRSVVQASVHPAGGSWSSPVDLSSTTGMALSPQVAVDAAGNATAVWQQDGATPVIQAAYRPAGGSWTTPEPLSDTSAGAFLPEVAVDAAGNAVAVWNSDLHVQWASRPAGGEWSDPDPFSGVLGEGAIAPALTMTPGGVATAAWTVVEGGHELLVEASRPLDGVWTSPTFMSSSTGDASEVDLASSASGAAVLTWSWFGPDVTTPDDTTDLASVVQARFRSEDTSAWGSVTDLSALSGFANGPEAAVDDAGRANVVWYASGPGGRIVQTARRGTAGTWSSPVDLSVAGVDGVIPDVAAAASGDMVAIWRDDNTADLQTSRRPVGLDGWGAPQDLPTPAPPINPHVAADAVGNVVAVWQTFDPDEDAGSAQVRALALDAVGPVLSDLTIPTKTPAGVATKMSVTAIDTWSAFSLVWSFGDGKHATGASVSHTYLATGRHRVSVTATDAVGNVTTIKGAIGVLTPAPILTGVRFTTPVIHLAGSDLRPRATQLKLILNTDAKVVVNLKRTRKLAGKAVTAKVAVKLKAGKRAIRLTSNVGTTRLPPGTYTVKVTATNFKGTSPATIRSLKIMR